MVKKVPIFSRISIPLLLAASFVGHNAYSEESERSDEGVPPDNVVEERALLPADSAVIVVSDQAEETPPVAPNVDLKEVAPAPMPIAVPVAGESGGDEIEEAVSADDQNEIVDSSALNTPAEESTTEQPDPPEQTAFVILGSEVAPSTAARLSWSPEVTIAGLTTPTPVLVINGKRPGQTLCMTAAIHGDELNGVEIIRRVMYDIDPDKLTGKLIGIPIVNIKSFQRGSRYLADRRDLNRAFPGDEHGSLAARVAYSLFNEVIVHCDALIDLHTGSFRRTNLLQVRADMSHSGVVKFTEGFDETVVVHSAGESGMLRQAAMDAGIIAVTLEAGESLRLQEDQVNQGVDSVNSLLQRQNMYSRLFSWGDPEPTYYRSQWIRANAGGILFSKVELGDRAKKNELLGVVTDPITNESTEIFAPLEGRVIGMAVNQVVMPGFAAYHLGIEAPEDCLAMPEEGLPEEAFPESADSREPSRNVLCKADRESRSTQKVARSAVKTLMDEE
ncbi:MAG: succinylglutamate desuccinylase [Gammaproteobacteria bacterium]|nr:MAG: succinylglutamate desuccinylase [Gammaproteobacteria bacterium]